MSEVKTCPFCGDAGEIFKNEAGFHAGCNTDGCIAESGIDLFFDTYEQCVAAWNRRAETGRAG